MTDLSTHNQKIEQCNLTGVSFDNCEMNGTIFDRTSLQKADLGTSYNYNIDPEKNHIKGAQFSSAGLIRLLGIIQ